MHFYFGFPWLLFETLAANLRSHPFILSILFGFIVSLFNPDKDYSISVLPVVPGPAARCLIIIIIFLSSSFGSKNNNIL
jgi:hypothetical protein